MSYASGTQVTVGRSVGEIQSTLRRYGATGFLYGEEGESAVLAFTMESWKVRFDVRMPPLSEFMETETGRVRKKGAAKTAHDQETRRRWRSLALVVKAKLEAVATGMVAFEDEFLANIVVPGGQTVGEFIKPHLEKAFASGKMPTLLLTDGRKKR